MHTILNIKNAVVRIDDVDYADAITSAVVTITWDEQEWNPISGNNQSIVGNKKFAVDLEFGQDLTANTTLTAVLLTKHGEAADIEIFPNGGTVPSIIGEAVLKAPNQLGGGTGVATATTSFKFNGTPTITFGVPTEG